MDSRPAAAAFLTQAELCILFHSAEICVEIHSRSFNSSAFEDFIVYQTVLSRNLCSSISGSAGTYCPALCQHIAGASFLEKMCAEYARYTSAYNENIGLLVAFKLRKLRQLYVFHPD